MTTATCVHSCKDLCNALASAERREREALGVYREFAATCDYPDVKGVLDALIAAGERDLALITAKREALHERFAALDRITDSFDA